MKNNCCASLFKIQKKCTSQKKPNDTYSVTAMETLLVSFCQKPNVLIF